MKQTALALCLLTSLSVALHAPKKAPELLIGAVHCLALKNFVPPLPKASRSFGYFLDEKSYPGEKVVYVVNYAAPHRTNGWVFVVFLTEQNGHQYFNIQNNATFVLSKRGVDRVSFVGAGQPLGGIWTQEHIVMAIKKIETQTRFTLDKKDFLAAMPSVSCESYTDNLNSHD
jgi:hypothetical protein